MKPSEDVIGPSVRPDRSAVMSAVAGDVHTTLFVPSVKVTVPVPASSRPPTVNATVVASAALMTWSARVVDRQRRDVGRIGVERDGVAGRAGRIALGVREAERGRDRPVSQARQIGRDERRRRTLTTTLFVPSVKVTCRAGIVQAADGEGNRGGFGRVDDMVGRVVDRQRRDLGRIGLSATALPVALAELPAVGEAERGRDRPVVQARQVGRNRAPLPATFTTTLFVPSVKVTVPVPASSGRRP